MSSNKLEDLQLTSDEVSKLQKAFKDEGFRKLFAEYAEEISDPENRKRYEDEIAQLENERGMDVKFVKPEPGYVLKTVTIPENVKTFVNICKNEHIEEARCNRQVGESGKSGLNWSIPHSFAPVREDIDKEGIKCKVIDFVIHPNTYRMAETNARFMKMIEDTALAGIEKQFGINLDKKNYKKPKSTFKGTPAATVIRSKKEGPVTEIKPDGDVLSKVKYPYSNKTSEEKAKELAEKVAKESKKKETEEKKEEDEYQVPTFRVKHRSNIEMQNFTEARDARPSTRPIELSVEVDLPLLKSSASVELDVFEKKLHLCSEKVAKYKLDLDLPYEVDESNGSAKFDKAARKLVITLPVVREKVPVPMLNGFSTDATETRDSPDAESELEVNPATETDQPLIEILSSEDYHGREGVDAASASSENSSEEVEASQEHKEEPEKTFVEPTESQRADIFYTMPPFDYLQDDETVTFILDVKNVKRDFLTKTFIIQNDKPVGVELKVKSVGPGGFPMYFRFIVQFLETNILDKEASYFDVGEHNLVATLVKADAALGSWEKFMVGSDKDKLQERLFLSEHYVKRQLDSVDREHGKPEEPGQDMPELEVTDMNTSQLLLNIKDSRGAGHSISESGEEIEVVHEKQRPKLHGILKPKSRTTSESSDDFLSNSYNRQYSTGGESSPTPLTEESEEDLGENGMKKSVSFSEEVDRTLYKVNQSVTSMRSTLKNKRKKAQKKEKKHAEREKKRSARRRRNSNSLSEPSSDEPSSPSEVRDGGRRGGEGSEEGEEEEEEEIQREENRLNAKQSSKKKVVVIDPKVTEAENVATVKGTKVEEKSSSNGTSANLAEAGCDKVTSRVTNGGAGGDNERTCDSDDYEEGEEEGEEGGKEITRANTNTSATINGVQASSSSSQEEEAKPKADTMLSWKEGASAEPKPQCAVEFSNSVMFELDLD